MRAVNLLPRQATSRSKLALDRTLIAAVAITVLVAAALIGGFFLEKAHASTEKQQLAAAQAALARALSSEPTKNNPAPAQLQIPVVLSQQEPWHLALDSALSTRVAWDVLLRQLEYVVPDNVRLSSVTLGSASGAVGGSITLGGTAFSEGDIANFIATLARVRNVTQVTLMSSAVNVGTNVVTFQVSAQLTLPAAAVASATASPTTTTGG
jgi:Tfp pilus assembly protein PilN